MSLRRASGPLLLLAALGALWAADRRLERRAYARLYSDGVTAAGTIAADRPARRDFWLVSPDPDLLWRYRPGIAIDLEMFTVSGPRRYRIETNEAGFRAPPFAPKAPGELRIAALGDSRTMGAGVRPEEAWPSVLEAILQGRLPNRPVRVLNLGVDGYTTFQGKALLAAVVPALRPDWVIAAYDVNDASLDSARDHAARAAALSRPLVRARGLLHRSALYLTLADLLRPLPDPEAGEGNGEGFVPNVSEGEFRENLREIALRAGDLGAKTLFVRIPLGGAFKTPPEEDDLARRVLRLAAIREEAAREAGTPLLDVSERFAGAPYETLYLESVHPAPEGHRRIAEAAADALGPL